MISLFALQTIGTTFIALLAVSLLIISKRKPILRSSTVVWVVYFLLFASVLRYFSSVAFITPVQGTILNGLAAFIPLAGVWYTYRE